MNLATERAARLAELIRDARSVVALTGAGISVPSGIPDFRSPGTGLWENANPMEVAHIDRSEEHTSELQSHVNIVCRLLLEKKKKAMSLSSNIHNWTISTRNASTPMNTLRV